MSKRSHFSSFVIRNAPVCAAFALAGVVGCSSTNVDPGPGVAGNSGTSGGSSAGTSSMTGGTGTTAGTSTGGAAGTTTTGGAGSSSGGTSSGGSGGSGGGSGGASGGSGGSGGSAGHGGSGGSGGGGGGGGSGGGGSGDCKSFKLCDDFETDAPGMGMSAFKVQQGGGYTVMVDTTQAHSGMKSIHISAPTGTGQGTLSETKTFPSTDFWGRAWMRFKTASGGHQMFIAVITQNDQFRLFNTLGSDNIQTNEQMGDKFYNSNTKVPMEKWFCFEWHVTANSAAIYMDGMALTGATPMGWNISNTKSLQIGYQRFQAGTSAGEIWLDDIAINDTQIGCQ